MDKVIIGVDLGGTLMRAARFDPALNLLDYAAELTLDEEGQDSVIRRLLALIERVIPQDRSSVLGIGISAPGPINPFDGLIINPPNLKGWTTVPLRQIVQDHCGIQTYLGNDANVAGLAEATSGAARGKEYVIYMTISTGIGGGVIDKGRMVIGAKGMGAEAGHMILVVDGRVSTLEKEASGTAIARKAVEQIRGGRASLIRDLVNGDLEKVEGKTVGEAAAQGDALAIDMIRQAGRMLGYGIVTLMHLFNPEIFVLGGGVIKTREWLFEPMHEAIRQHTLTPVYWENVPIVPAELGDNVALIGAAALVTTRGGSYLYQE
jgi:glucokinase